MQYWFIILALLGVCSFATAQASITEQKIEVLFNSTLTMENLEIIQADMATQNIDLQYESLTFSKAGKLESISFKVDYNDGSFGTASSRKLSPKSRMGFRRVFDKKGNCFVSTTGLIKKKKAK